MFWKRKPKKQDGPDATDSAAEVAVEAKDEADVTESEDTVEAAGEDTGGEAETKPKAEPDTGDAESQDADADAEDAADAEDEKKPADLFAAEDEEVGVTGPDSDGITRVRTAGVLDFDGEKTEVVSNTWIVQADDDGVIVIDPGHDADAILEAVGEREVYLVACTNGYSPHIEAAIKVAEETESDIALHPREMRAWRRFHGAEHRPEIEVEGEGALDIGDLHVDVLALPGTSSGTVGYYVSELGVVFSGDTLRKGEPGMVGNTYIDYTTQLASIGEGLLSLPPDTRVLPDRGPSTNAAAESKNFDSWV